MNSVNLLFGKYILETEGLICFNEEYAEKLGRYVKYRDRLVAKGITTDKQRNLLRHYETNIRAAKYWATYPKDTTELSKSIKVSIGTKRGRRRSKKGEID